MGELAIGGYAWGGTLAMILSWSVNHSVLWCLVHSLCSWVYVIYYCIHS